MKDCLLLVDLQNDYFPGGAMELDDISGRAARARLLLDHFRSAGLPVIHIRHISRQAGATFFLPGTDGAEIHQLVAPLPRETVFVKHYPNSFRDTPLLQLLRDTDIEHLTVCGAMSHLCIDTTVRAAFDLGFACTVAADACATRDLEFDGAIVPAPQVHAASMSALSRPFARVTDTRKILHIMEKT